jgi:ABC-type multidrug transport system ATPase subunit
VARPWRSGDGLTCGWSAAWARASSAPAAQRFGTDAEDARDNFVRHVIEWVAHLRDEQRNLSGGEPVPMHEVPPTPHEHGPEDIVTIAHATKTFGDKVALHDMSFSVPSGQICGLLGPNGAGKTTLFRLLMGILKASSGVLQVAGLDAFEDRVAVKRLIGFLPDEPVFYSYLSGWELLELSAGMHGLDTGEAMAWIDPLAQRLRLFDDLDNYAEDFSRGMKKKLGLLLALLHRPRLLVLDEPTNGLDVEATHLFYDLIGEVAAGGTTVLFSTHLMDHVTRLCSHAVIINEGSLIAKGSLAELKERHEEESLEALFLKLTARPQQA